MANIPSQAERNVIRIMCPRLSCQRVLAVPSNARGKLVRCKGCGANIRIPVKKKTEGEAGAAPAAQPQAGQQPAAQPTPPKPEQ